MSLVVGTNIGSLNAQRSLASSGIELKSAMERLSTGKRINSAADDAAGFAIAERMTAQIRGLNMAVKNANDGLSMLSVADAAADDITDMLQRMRELAVQAGNDTNSAADRQYLQNELEALTHEIDRVATQTQYNGENLLDGSKSASFQVGSQPNQTVSFDFRSLTTSSFEGISSVGTTSAASASNSGPETDLSDPVLTGITIDKSVVDVSSGSQTISVELSVADESKIKNAKAWFQHVETGNIRTESIHGEYDAGLLPPIEWTVDQSTQAGMWELFRIDIDDTATNGMYLYPNQLTGQNFPIEVVGGNTDLSDPVLTGITIDKSVVDVSSGSQTISVELSVADESKIKNAKAWFQHVETGNIRTESIHGEYDAGLLPPIEWTVDQSTQAGMWELFRIDIDDTATNHMYLYPINLLVRISLLKWSGVIQT